jgi:TolA-binding protein
MMDTSITRAEHEEFSRRLEEENQRQDKRIALLEENQRQIGSLTVSVEKLAQSLELMVKEQEKQGKRLEVLEGRDGERWRKVMGYLATSAAGMLLGLLFSQLGIG